MNITKRPAIGERILRRALIAFVAFGWLIGQEKVVADDYLWIAGTGLWDNDNNWDPFGHPDGAGDTATFNAIGPPTFNVSLNAGTFTINTLFLNGDSGDGYTFSSGTLQLDSVATIYVETHNTAVDMNANLTLALLANATINTALADTTFQIAGQITGGFSLTKIGDGTLTLTGNNNYSGGTTLNAGTLLIGSDTALGTSTFTINGGTFGITASSFINNSVVVNADFNIISTNVLGFQGPIDLGGGSRTITGLSDGDGNNVQFNGVISNGTGLTLAGVSLNEFNYTMGGVGSNTYTGTTVVDNAALSLNKIGAAIAIPGDLTVQNGGFVTFSATGQLAVTTLITLDQGNLGTALDVTVPNNIVLLSGFNQAFEDTGTTLTLGGMISGAGTLAQAGDFGSGGTLVLTNSNNYSGGTDLDTGTLYADNNNALGTGTLTIEGGTTLGSHVGGTTLANNVVVNGNFSITPASGGMTLSGNIDLGATTRTITNTTVQNSAFTAFFSGVISGAGGLTLEAPNIGYFEFTGANANTYGGLTTVQNSATLNLNKTPGVNAVPGDVMIGSSGLVQLFAANQIPDTATVTDNGEFNLVSSPETIGTLNGSGSVDLSSTGILTVGAGNFSGIMKDNLTPGELVKNTAGTLILTGNNTYTGGTTINGGVLAVGNINALGTGNVIVNTGTLQTFGGPRQIDIGGNYTQNSGGTLQLQIGGTTSGSQSDFLSVTGAASLGGTLSLIRINNFNPVNGARVDIIADGAGHTGAFDTVISTFGMLQPTVHYDEALDVYILFQLSSFSGLTGLTPNQKSVAHELDNVANDPAAAALINFLGMEPLGALPHDFDLIAPEELASIYEIGFSQAVVQNDNLQRRMDDIRAGSNGFCADGFVPQVSGKDYTKDSDGKGSLPDKNTRDVYTPAPDNRWGVFVTGTGDFVNVGNNDSNAPGYDITTGDVTVGADYRLCNNFAIGIDAGYSRSTADLVDDGRVDVDGGKVGAYATMFGKGLFGSKFYVDGAVGGGFNSYDTRRTGLQDEPVRGSTDGSEFNAMISYGSDWTFGCFNIGTWSSVQYTNVSIDQFTETGSLAPLIIQDQDENSFRATTGLHASYDIKAGHFIFRPEVRAAYQHEYCDQAYQVDSQLASGAGTVFRVRGPNIGRDAALVGTGMSMQWNNRLSTYVYYDGVLGRNNYDNNAVSGGFRIGF
jgi:outer membrane autotransporter protein